MKLAKMSLRGVSYLIIDEMSLIGTQILGYISQRLKLVFGSDEVFGGLNLLLLGDFRYV